MNDTLTEESLKEIIKSIVDSQTEFKDDIVTIHYCKGIGASVRTNSLSAITCDHPECYWCRGMEKALEKEFNVKTKELLLKSSPILEMKTDKKTISNGFRKVKKGSKFTKKKKRNR